MNGSLIPYILHLADNVLILAQRNSEWCGHGPVLEQDIAITNISLDLLGQARNFYQYAAQLINDSPNSDHPNIFSLLKTGSPVTEDSLAYLRSEREFKNCLLVEQPNGDWGQTILRQFLFSAYQYELYQKLEQSKDEQLAAIAIKSLKEVTYHLRWSSEWVIRLGDGTEESHKRMLTALENLWPYSGEMFIVTDYEKAVSEDGSGVDPKTIKNDWGKKVNEIFTEATIPVPTNIFQQTGGKEGTHSELLGYILTELQFMQKSYPGSNW